MNDSRMTRREAASRSALLVAAASCSTLVSSRSAVAAEGAEPWLRKTLKVGMIRVPGSLEDKFQVAREAGFAGVEMNVPGVDVVEANLASRATGLIIDGTVGGYHWGVRHSDPNPDVRSDALSKLKAGIRQTAAMGADTMLLVPGHGKDGTQSEVQERSIESIQQALPDCERYRVSLLIENVWNHFLYDHDGGNDQTADRLAAYVDAFDSKWVGVQFDIGNHWKYGDPAAWIRTLGHRVKKLDIKGFSRANNNWARITDGDIDWPAVEKALREIGFTGWLAAEVGGGDLRHLKNVSERLERALHCSKSV